jgi:hypothetical protein
MNSNVAVCLNDTKSDDQDIDIQLVLPRRYVTPRSGYFVFEETPEFYRRYTLPYILNKRNKFNASWVKSLGNVDKSNEIQNVLVRTNNFVAYIDRAWINKGHHCDTNIIKERSQWGLHPDTDESYYSVDVFLNGNKYENELMTLRDVKYKHLNLLLKIKKKVLRKSFSIYGVKEDDLTIFARYLPRGFIFHLHFVHNKNPYKKKQKYRDFFLKDIERNIRKNHNYYQEMNIETQVFFDLDQPTLKQSYYQHILPLLNKKFNYYKTKNMVWRPDKPVDQPADKPVVADKPADKSLNWRNPNNNNKYQKTNCFQVNKSVIKYDPNNNNKSKNTNSNCYKAKKIVSKYDPNYNICNLNNNNVSKSNTSTGYKAKRVAIKYNPNYNNTNKSCIPRPLGSARFQRF